MQLEESDGTPAEQGRQHGGGERAHEAWRGRVKLRSASLQLSRARARRPGHHDGRGDCLEESRRTAEEGFEKDAGAGREGNERGPDLEEAAERRMRTDLNDHDRTSGSHGRVALDVGHVLSCHSRLAGRIGR